MITEIIMASFSQLLLQNRRLKQVNGKAFNSDILKKSFPVTMCRGMCTQWHIKAVSEKPPVA